MSLRPLNQRPSNNFLIFRYFNLAAEELRFNIQGREGNLLVIANIQKYKLTDSNPYFQIPLSLSTSAIAPININRTQNTSLVFSSTINSRLMCQFCWYYITVFQNMTSNRNTFTNFSINVTEPIRAYNSIPLMT